MSKEGRQALNGLREALGLRPLDWDAEDARREQLWLRYQADIERARRNRIILVAIAIACIAILAIASASHGGEVGRARRIGRALAKPIKAKGRADAGYPLRQAIKNTTAAGAYVAGTAFRLSGLIPTSGGVIANILIGR